MSPDIYDNPELYDLEYRTWTRDAQFYRDIVGEFLGGPAEVLELACGTGRVTRELLRDGHHVFAFDVSPGMLRGARRRLDQADELERQRAHLFCADMRSFSLRRRVPIAVCCFNSLEHLHRDQDVLACLSRVHDVLARDGLFIFDVHNPEPRVLGHSAKKVWGRGTFKGSDGGWVRRSMTSHYHRTSQVHEVTIRYQRLAEDKSTPVGQAFSQKLEQRQFWPNELLRLVESAGFRVRLRLGEFDHSPFQDDSVSQILVCQPIVRASK